MMKQGEHSLLTLFRQYKALQAHEPHNAGFSAILPPQHRPVARA